MRARPAYRHRLRRRAAEPSSPASSPPPARELVDCRRFEPCVQISGGPAVTFRVTRDRYVSGGLMGFLEPLVDGFANQLYNRTFSLLGLAPESSIYERRKRDTEGARIHAMTLWQRAVRRAGAVAFCKDADAVDEAKRGDANCPECEGATLG